MVSRLMSWSANTAASSERPRRARKLPTASSSVASLPKAKCKLRDESESDNDFGVLRWMQAGKSDDKNLALSIDTVSDPARTSPPRAARRHSFPAGT
jgi:hypothetical protein